MKLQGDQNGYSLHQPSPTEIKKRRDRLIGNPPKPEPAKVAPTVSEPKGLRGKEQVKCVVMDKALVERIAVLEAENAYLKKSLALLEPGRPVSVEAIQHYVAKNWGVRRVDLLASRRTQGVTEPRHVAMYFCKNFTQRSLPELGRMFGGRDHSTIHHAVQKVTIKRTLDPDFDARVAKLERYFEQAERQAEGTEPND